MQTRKKKNNKRKRKNKQKSKTLFFVKSAFLLFMLLMATGGILVYSVYAGLWGKLPDYEELRNVRNAEASAKTGNCWANITSKTGPT